MTPGSLQRIRAMLRNSLAVLLLISLVAQAEPFPVSVILSESTGVYKEFADALSTSLQNNNVTLNVIEVTQPQPPSKLVIAVGIKAANAAAVSNAANILNVMIPKSGHKKLLLEFPKRDNSSRYSTIYLDQPIERQLSLIAAAFPDRRRLGVMFESSNSSDLHQILQYANEYDLELYEKEVTSASAMFETLQVVLQHSDVMLALPAPSIYNSTTLRNILVSTYQSHTPLVGFSAAYVKAGAMCAVITTPEQFANQAGTAILKFIETGTLPAPQHPKHYDISVNDRVAQSMGIAIKTPDELFRKMSATKGRAP